MAANTKTAFTIDIIPGESIGPIRLEMTSPEIKEAILSFPSQTQLTLDDLGIVAWSRGENHSLNSVEEGPCVRLGIRVWNTSHEIRLWGQSVNNISNDDAVTLFERYAGKLAHSYGGFDSVKAGVDAVRWEDSDPWIDSIFVMKPERK